MDENWKKNCMDSSFLNIIEIRNIYYKNKNKNKKPTNCNLQGVGGLFEKKQ